MALSVLQRRESGSLASIYSTLLVKTLCTARNASSKNPWKSLDPAEIRGEVRKAETFPSKLDHYTILTTAKISGAAQLSVQAINQEHKASRLFTIELFTREKISELIRQYLEIEGEFYGGLRFEQATAVNSKLDYVAKLTESVTANSATTEIDALIDDARGRITPKEAQIAVLLLNRIQQSKGGQISNWHRFRILTNLGAASLMLGKGTEATRYFLDAKPLRPDDELAITNEVLAYHLLLQENETCDRSARAMERFPNSAHLRSLWIQAAPREKPYDELLDATPGHLRKDAEVASALSRRAMASGFLDRAIDAEAYYAILAHESTHWTCHEKRLNRERPQAVRRGRLRGRGARGRNSGRRFFAPIGNSRPRFAKIARPTSPIGWPFRVTRSGRLHCSRAPRTRRLPA